jgi:hypothetical protein
VLTLWKLGVAMVVSAYTAARGTENRTLRPQDEHFCIRTRETAGLATGCLEPLDIFPVTQDTSWVMNLRPSIRYYLRKLYRVNGYFECIWVFCS